MVGTFTLLKYTIYYCLLYRNIGFNLNVNIYWTPDFVFFWCIFWLNLHKGEYLRRKISVFFRQHAASIYGFVRQSASECVKKKLHSVWLQLLLLLLLLLILLPHSGPNWEFQPYLKSCNLTSCTTKWHNFQPDYHPPTQPPPNCLIKTVI